MVLQQEEIKIILGYAGVLCKDLVIMLNEVNIKDDQVTGPISPALF